MKQHIFESVIEMEYELSDAETICEFASNPSPEALSASVIYTIEHDGLGDIVADEEIEAAVVKCLDTQDYELLGKLLIEKVKEAGLSTLEYIASDMRDSKCDSAEEDYIEVDRLSRIRDLA